MIKSKKEIVMKKVSIILNVCLALILICSFYYLIVEAIRLESFCKFLSEDYLYGEYIIPTINSSILVALSSMSLMASIFLIVVFNINHHGTSMRERLSEKLMKDRELRLAKKETRAAEKKSKEIAELQARIDELNKQ